MLTTQKKTGTGRATGAARFVVFDGDDVTIVCDPATFTGKVYGGASDAIEPALLGRKRRQRRDAFFGGMVSAFGGGPVESSPIGIIISHRPGTVRRRRYKGLPSDMVKIQRILHGQRQVAVRVATSRASVTETDV